MKFLAAIVLLLSAMAHAQAAAPVVYADDNITVRAAVAEAGVEPIHLGDVLTLVVEIAFDPDEVQVETLDRDWFARVFADLPAVSLVGSGAPVTDAGAGDAVHVVARWEFQLVACPPGAGHCPGAKRYTLPVADLAYRLASAEDSAMASRSARFTPWPGTVVAAPSIAFDPRGDTGVDAVIPGGAWPAPRPLPNEATLGTAILAAGGLLLAAGLIGGRRPGRLPATSSARARPDSRWERAALGLADDGLDDAAWSDLLRRCLAWYCLDELGHNPAAWLRAHDDPLQGDPGQGDPVQGGAAECRALYLDLLSESGVPPERREDFRTRFREATGSGLPAP